MKDDRHKPGTVGALRARILEYMDSITVIEDPEIKFTQESPTSLTLQFPAVPHVYLSVSRLEAIQAVGDICEDELSKFGGDET